MGKPLMAMCDYRLCDVCGEKAFYDAAVLYDFDAHPDTGLHDVGAWVVICRECALTHEVRVIPRIVEK